MKRSFLFQSKTVRFIIGGGLAAFLNLLLIHVLIDQLGFNTPTLRNLANAVAVEASLVFSFFVYRLFVWTHGSWNLREVLLRQIPLYHVSAGTAVLSRVLLIFPVLDAIGVNYIINTLVGVVLSASLNYVLSDRFVFTQSYSRDISILPEGLEPIVGDRKLIPPSSTATSSIKTNRIETFSVVIPAYNEEDCIVNTVETIAEVLQEAKIKYEILVINDSSKDSTEQLLKGLSQNSSNICYINSYYPNGFGFAVRCGLENFRGDAVAIVMADASDLPQDIVTYYQKLNDGYDCVFGSRFTKGARVIDYPKVKLLINRLANLFISFIMQIEFNDTTNAFKAYRREVIDGVFPLLSHHFNLTVEIPLKAIIRGYSYTVVPVSWRNRTTGVSKLKLKEMGSRYLFIVLSVWLEKHLAQGDYTKPKKSLARSAIVMNDISRDKTTAKV